MKKKYILKIVGFICAFIIIFNIVDHFLERPINEQWDHSGLRYIYNNKNYYDVIFVGTSITITNISNEELYLKYGIAGVTIGEPSQPTYLSYYSLEEALKYQNPKAVLFDVNSLFYTEDDLRRNVRTYDEYHHLHYSLDNMKNNATKYNAFCQAKEITPEINFWNYFSKIYYNHSNWENISKENFVRKSGYQVMNGNYMNLNLYSAPDKVEDLGLNGENTGEITSIPDINRIYLNKMINLCREKNIMFILTRGGGTYTWEKYNTIVNYAEEYNIPYLDLNDFENLEKIDLLLDSSDGNHFNMLGAKKWTDILGSYLQQKLEFKDRRKDHLYDDYMEQKEKYDQFLKVVEDTVSLNKEANLNGYLKALNELDNSNITIFIAVKDEAATNLTDDEEKALQNLGFEKSLLGKQRYSYIGISGNGLLVEEIGKDQLHTFGMIDENVSYEVISGGYEAGSVASILINGEEKAQNGRGFNFVVYNSTVNNVISSVYFDTYQYKNAPISRIVEIQQEQYAEEYASWKPLEEYK